MEIRTTRRNHSFLNVLSLTIDDFLETIVLSEDPTYPVYLYGFKNLKLINGLIKAFETKILNTAMVQYDTIYLGYIGTSGAYLASILAYEIGAKRDFSPFRIQLIDLRKVENPHHNERYTHKGYFVFVDDFILTGKTLQRAISRYYKLIKYYNFNHIKFIQLYLMIDSDIDIKNVVEKVYNRESIEICKVLNLDYAPYQSNKQPSRRFYTT